MFDSTWGYVLSNHPHVRPDRGDVLSNYLHIQHDRGNVLSNHPRVRLDVGVRLVKPPPYSTRQGVRLVEPPPCLAGRSSRTANFKAVYGAEVVTSVEINVVPIINPASNPRADDVGLAADLACLSSRVAKMLSYGPLVLTQ
jgi:hypothetical protein